MRGLRLTAVLALLGPGVMVMLADTDAGSVVTAAQSGATFRYRLLVVELLLVPVLYVVMELAARLALVTGKGITELIREHLGGRWAALAVGALTVSVLGALVTEFAGLAGAGEMFGVRPWLTVPTAAALLIALVVSGGYRRVEIVGIALGSLELVFVAAAALSHPRAHQLGADIASVPPLGNHAYLALVAANVGAVVMPWMLFYQPSAILQKGLTRRHLRSVRIDTAAGALATQVVMASIVVAAAASLHAGGPIATVGQLATALTPALGATGSRVVLALGIGGAALVACIVVSLAASWAVADALGRPRSLDSGVRHARLFYAVYAAVVGGGASIVLSSHSLVHLAVNVQILNALLLPIVLGFLAVLARRALPRPYRQRRRHRVALVATAGPVAFVALIWVGIALGL